MARESKVVRDFDPVSTEYLLRYPDPSDDSVTTLTVRNVMVGLPFKNHDGVRRYTIEVEYKSEEWAIDDKSFALDYLRKFERAKAPQEAVLERIQNDLCQVLETDTVFVEVRRAVPADKRARLGKA